MTNVTEIRKEPRKRAAPKRHEITESTAAIRVPQMCQMLNIGAVKAQELINSGRVKSFKIGRSRLINLRSVLELVEGEAA